MPALDGGLPLLVNPARHTLVLQKYSLPDGHLGLISKQRQHSHHRLAVRRDQFGICPGQIAVGGIVSGALVERHLRQPLEAPSRTAGGGRAAAVSEPGEVLPPESLLDVGVGRQLVKVRRQAGDVYMAGDIDQLYGRW